MTEVAGSVAVEVTADLSRYNKGMDEAARRAHSFDKEARGATDRVKDSFAGMVGTIGLTNVAMKGFSGALGVARVAAGAFAGPIGVLLGGAGVVGLGIAVGQCVQEFAQFETELLTLNAVLTATGGAAGRTVDDILSLADAISTTTLATDNAVRGASAQLLTFRSISGDVFDRALKGAQDLAAIGFGSIESAAATLGRALESPEEGLSRLRRAGINVTESQRQLIRSLVETGRTADAQRAILDLLESKVGGAGSAQAGGLSGAFHRLREATSNWFESLGGGIAKAIGLQGSIQGVTEWVNRLNEAMKVPGQGSLADQMAKAQNAVTALDTRYAELNDRLERHLIIQSEMIRTGQPGLSAIASRIAEINRELTETVKAANNARVGLESLTHQQFIAQEAAYGGQVQAEVDAARDKFNGVINALNRNIEALGRTELAQRALDEARKAGVLITSAEGKEIAKLIAQTDALERSRRRAQALYSPEALQTFRDSLLNQEQEESTSHHRRLEQIGMFLQQRMVNEIEANNMVQQEAFRHAQAMAQIEIQKNDMIASARNSALQEGVNLLGVFAAKSKVAALAQLALNKGLAIAQAIQNTTVAATRALAELGPIAGPPMAASIKAWGAVQVGLIAATGLTQAAGIAGGGGPGGGGGSSGGGGATTANTAQSLKPTRAVHITLEPHSLFSSEQVQKLIGVINEEVKDGSVLLTTENLRS